MQGKKSPISKEEVLSAIQRLGKELGRAPTWRELEGAGIGYPVVRKHFQHYRAAVRAAGLEPVKGGTPNRVSNQQLLEDWGRVARLGARLPTERDYKNEGRYSHKGITDRFQRWSAIPGAFVEAERRGELSGDWKDVVEMVQNEPKRAPYQDRVWTQKFMAALRRGRGARWTERDAEPANVPPALAGKKCVTATMLAVFVGSVALGGGFLRRVMMDRPLLGPPMHEAALAHEPVNEMGVGMLFAMKARELGFIIESVQPGFPDCRAKMEVMPGKWQDVRIEFEKDSRGFVEHGHDPKGCDMIVCWQHDWKTCPRELMVLELGKVIGRSGDRRNRRNRAESPESGKQDLFTAVNAEERRS